MAQQYIWPAQSVTATNPSVGVNGLAIPASSTQVGGKDPGGLLKPIKVNALGEQDVNVISSALPTGAATEATLLSVDSRLATANITLSSIDSDTAAMVLSLASIDSKLANPMPVSGPLTDAQLRASAVPVSAASLPLPTGAATEATLLSVDSRLSSIDTKLANPMPVSGPLTDAQLRASAVPVSAASLPLPTGAATEATLSAMSAKLPAALGAQTISGSMAVNIASDQIVPVSVSGKDTLSPVRNDYTGTPVTTGAYVQLVASTAAAVSEIEIFDSSGQTLVLALGPAASEVNKVIIFPGGNGRIPLKIPASTRVSVKALSANATVGELDINFYE